MSEEIEVAKAVATHPLSLGGFGLTVIGWLFNRVWRGHRHEIANMKLATAAAVTVLEKKADKSELEAAWKAIEKRQEIEAKLFDQIREHEASDRDRFERQEAASRDRHDELIALVGDLRADIATVKR